MESYRVNQPARSSRPHNGAGSYGLSIRVQGIDGHPTCNGYNDTQGSFIDNYHEYDFKGSREAVSDSPFVEYRSQKQMQFGGSHNGVTEQGKKPASTLLNFQRHPEILKPYDPENNTLNLDCNHSLPPRPMSLAETGSTYQPPSPSQPPLSLKPNYPPSEQTKASCRSASSISSANSSLERSRHEPDILPLRRVDSSGPVLQSSSRSRHSSTSSTDQLEALYADTINRHQNRRYIPFQPGTGRDIDTGSIPGVDELIATGQGRPQEQDQPEDRKRSRSVDSALPFSLQGESEYMDEFSKNQGRSTEHVLRPSQLHLQKVSGRKNSWVTAVEGKPSAKASACGSSAPGSPQSITSKAAGSIQGYKVVLNRSSTLPLDSTDAEDGQSSPNTKILTSNSDGSLFISSCIQVTPDLLKGQQELSQQTHEETAKQILFNYLKDGSTDNEDTTKRKVNLVFEKIQTLKSRAAGSDNKVRHCCGVVKQMGLTEAHEKAGVGVKVLQTELERSQEECSRLRDKLAKTEAELRTTLEELFQVKMEREQYQTEIRDLQDQLSEMHDELDGAKTVVADGEKDAMMEDLMQMKLDLQEVLLAKEEQEEVLRRRERELTALKGALKEEVATHDQEVDKLREQYEKEICKLQTSVEKAKQVTDVPHEITRNFEVKLPGTFNQLQSCASKLSSILVTNTIGPFYLEQKLFKLFLL
uniref:Myosin tail domain-containing protein n=1 Tax=Oncorhynchus tshawytscha TaxID=74940 RepID=A0AAZ3SPU3_ONCTS